MPFRKFLVIPLLIATAIPVRAQLGELNFLTDLNTPFPPGCLSIDLPDQPRSGDSLVLDQTIAAPTINSDTRDGSVLVRAWRVACADDGFSVVLVRMRQVGGDRPIVVPQVFADSGDSDFPLHQAQLQLLPGAGNIGASGDIITTGGTTWMLAVDPVPLQGDGLFVNEDYNETFSLEFNWGSYAPAEPEGIVFVIDRFDPALDLPQFEQPVLNGRYSGQWTREGAANQGLVLQIAEQLDQNFVFAIFFTYLDGEPVWVTGNSEPALPEPGPVTIEMFTLENGAFITDASQPPADQVPDTDAGSIEIEVMDCNNLRVNYDFEPLGKGSGSIELQRLIRIAGYDCNPWQ